MPELMLRPGWPGSFRRTVGAGKKARLLKFPPGQPVSVTEAEMKALQPDIGVALFKVERDEKDRPRFVESGDVHADPTQPDPNQELEPDANVEDV